MGAEYMVYHDITKGLVGYWFCIKGHEGRESDCAIHNAVYYIYMLLSGHTTWQRSSVYLARNSDNIYPWVFEILFCFHAFLCVQLCYSIQCSIKFGMFHFLE